MFGLFSKSSLTDRISLNMRKIGFSPHLNRIVGQNLEVSFSRTAKIWHNFMLPGTCDRASVEGRMDGLVFQESLESGYVLALNFSRDFWYD